MKYTGLFHLIRSKRIYERCLQFQLRKQSTLNEKSSARLSTEPFEQIPGPKGVFQLPFIGVALQLKSFTDHGIQNFGYLAGALHEQFGSICKVRLGFDWQVFVFDPDDVQKVVRHEGKYPDMITLPLFATYNQRTNRVTSMAERQGEDWKKLRSPAQKCIARPKPMEKFIPKLSLIADDFVDMCRKNGKLSNLPDPLMELAAESVGMLCFNKRLECLAQAGSIQNQIFMSHVKTYFQYFGDQLLSTIKWFKYFRTPGYRKFEVASDYIMNIIDVNIEESMKEAIDGNTQTDEASLIQNLFYRQGMTPSSISSILIDLFRGGIESSANTIMLVLYQLAKHPDKQEILFNELKDSISSRGAMDENSLHNLKYLKACMKESMRLIYPVAFGSSRKLDQDIELQGYNVPAGIRIVMCTGIISKTEKYFTQPEKFLPERWLREKGKKAVHPFAFHPFGIGPRMCVGQRFAEMEILIAVSKIIRNFRLSLPEDFTEISIIYRTFATVERPLTINLEQRE